MVKNNYTGTKNTFVSAKTGKTFQLRSMLERKYANLIEHNVRVLTYDYESVTIPYVDPEGNIRNYRPDFLVIYLDRTVKIIEVKPKTFVLSEEVQCKKAGAEDFLKKEYKNFKISFEIVTEVDLVVEHEEVIRRLIREKETNRNILPNVKKRRRSKKPRVTRHRDDRAK